MQPLPRLTALHAEYATLALAGTRALTEDEVRSIAYYRAEIAFINDPHSFVGSTSAVVLWCQFVYMLEAFVDVTGRLPRQNNRLSEELIDWAEWDLAEQLRYRQGRAARLDRLCRYQKLRHNCIPGYREHPREAAWEDRFQAYGAFVRDFSRAPLYRSEDTAEKSLAAWAAVQRAAYRADTLSMRRRLALTGLSFWTWGHR